MLTRSISALVALVALVPALRTSAAPATTATAPATAPATTRAARTPRDVAADLNMLNEELNALAESQQGMTEAEAGLKIAPKAIGLLKMQLALLDELVALDPRTKIGVARQRIHGALANWGDKEALAALEKAAKGNDKAEALAAALALCDYRWMAAGKDEKAQTKVVDEMERLLRQTPESDEVALALWQMSQGRLATPEIGRRMEEILMKEAKGKLGRNIAGALEAQRRTADTVPGGAGPR